MSGALVEVEEAVECDPYGGKVGSGNVHVGAVPLEVALIIHPTQLSDAGQRHGHKQLCQVYTNSRQVYIDYILYTCINNSVSFRHIQTRDMQSLGFL